MMTLVDGGRGPRGRSRREPKPRVRYEGVYRTLGEEGRADWEIHRGREGCGGEGIDEGGGLRVIDGLDVGGYR